ncbi:Asp-tRNA(Asn)/Glu-tRNA(Gln) amidotransferase subunit GatC [Candidatus Uhrbacteria bacterium]|nr:Asp-tRNA(Asn)/Glu-tRNA(Gln) amidotransferase subunit GatC [Candidatus Uhrbacteria bacterium]
MSLSNEEVKNVAHLARIGLREEEVETVGAELNKILGYIDRLQKIDTTGVPEAASPLVEAARFREDVVNSCTDAERAQMIEGFPAKQGAMLKAPAIFEKPKQ